LRNEPKFAGVCLSRLQSIRAKLLVSSKARNHPTNESSNHEYPNLPMNESPNHQPSLSVVISTADRPEMVRTCLQSMNTIGVPESVEVLVVDAGRQKPVDSGEIRAVRSTARLISYGVRNMALQRNEGIRQARGEIVCFIDDDTYLQPGWWPKIVEPFSEKTVGGVAGAIWCKPKPEFTDRRGGYVNWYGEPVQITHRSTKAPREIDWTIGANMAFRKEAAVAVGGLAEVYGIYDEDVDFGLRLRKAGWRVVFQPEAAVYHYCNTRPKPPATKQTEFRAGRNRMLLIFRNYGVSLRLVIFLLTAPLRRFARATLLLARAAVTVYGHAVAYTAGMFNGIAEGVRNPVAADPGRFQEQGTRTIAGSGVAERKPLSEGK